MHKFLCISNLFWCILAVAPLLGRGLLRGGRWLLELLWPVPPPTPAMAASHLPSAMETAPPGGGTPTATVVVFPTLTVTPAALPHTDGGVHSRGGSPFCKVPKLLLLCILSLGFYAMCVIRLRAVEKEQQGLCAIHFFSSICFLSQPCKQVSKHWFLLEQEWFLRNLSGSR
jgi:hypothetical protein